MAIKCTLNRSAFKAAATEAGDVWPDGRLHLTRISKRTGVHRTALGRVASGERKPDLATVMAFARAYKKTVEQLIITADESPELQATA